MFSPVFITIVILVGVLIGGAGIGGVLLLPSLQWVAGISLHQSITACMLSYIVTGIIGVKVYAKHGTINWPLAMAIMVGALPGAYLGAALLPYLSPATLELCIGLLILASGVHTLSSTSNLDERHRSTGSIELAVIGLITGIGSALSGTGGPLLLIPILIWRRVPLLTTIGLAQAIQIPISTAATLGNIIHAEIDYGLAFTLAFFLGIGALLGAKITHLLPVKLLKPVVAVLLIFAGSVMLF